MCPITGQPDFYRATIEYRPDAHCLESKSLKIYLSRFRDQGAFCEALAVQIRDEVAAALELAPGAVHVTLEPEGARRHHDHRRHLGGDSPRTGCPPRLQNRGPGFGR